jgi:hypothetical protein
MKYEDGRVPRQGVMKMGVCRVGVCLALLYEGGQNNTTNVLIVIM